MLKFLLMLTTLSFSIIGHGAIIDSKYRNEWFAEKSAYDDGLPKKIDIGFLGAKVDDMSCDYERPANNDEKVTIKCKGYKSIYVEATPRLENQEGDILYVTFEGRTEQYHCYNDLQAEVLHIPVEETICGRNKLYLYFSSDYKSPFKNSPKNW